MAQAQAQRAVAGGRIRCASEVDQVDEGILMVFQVDPARPRLVLQLRVKTHGLDVALLPLLFLQAFPPGDLLNLPEREYESYKYGKQCRRTNF